MPLLVPQPEARFWGSGPEAGARFHLFGAPLDLTGSGRLGTGKAPPAVRRASHNIESYSPRLDGDLFDAGLVDLGDLDLASLTMEAALAEIERQVDSALQDTARPASPRPAWERRSQPRPSTVYPPPSTDYSAVPIVVGGEHTIALAI